MSPSNTDGMRASDSDREGAVAVLIDAYAADRLNLGDMRDRAGAAYRAQTWGDLRKLTIDLGPGRVFQPAPAGTGTRPGSGYRRRQDRSGVPVLLVMLAVLAMAAAVSMPTVSAPLAALPLIVMSMSALFAAGMTVTLRIAAAETGAAHAGWPPGRRQDPGPRNPE